MKKILTIREKRILKLQILFLIFSFGLVAYSMWVKNNSPGLFSIGLFLSVISSTVFAFLLNRRRFFLTLMIGILFPPIWFIISIVVTGLSLGGDKQLLIMMLFGYIPYFKLILKTEGYSGLQWKQLW